LLNIRPLLGKQKEKKKKKEKDRCDDGEQRLLKKGVAELAFLRMAEILRAHSARQETSPLLANQGNDSTAIVIQKSVQSAVETEIVGENAKASASQRQMTGHRPSCKRWHGSFFFFLFSFFFFFFSQSHANFNDGIYAALVP